ncbi:MAG: glycosyltransferase family 4 protein [Flavobacteriaceae bacterium]|nr:glycosyltransferase family 4 protein [Flavobacteriaceae bacterium]
MKVLIITYYWYPSGGSGVQRWLKFVKYLREFGIEPIIYTVENPNYDFTDTSLFDDIPKDITVLRQPIFEPHNLFKKKKESAGFLKETPSFLGKVKKYIRANYFIPDARKFWIKPSVKFLQKYLSENTDIQTIISTGPPHSTHLIALQLKEKLSLKWITDFRDPWTDIDYFHKLPLTEKSLKKHRFLEKKVLQSADKVIVVGDTMKKNYQKITDNVLTITNGYDTENTKNQSFILDKKFTLTHIGLMNADRNPSILWESIAEICKKNKDFKQDFLLQLIGNIDDSVLKNIEKYQLNDNVKIINYIPHSEVIDYQKKSQLLLLIVNNVPSAKGIITGKIFEYLQAQRPIVAIAPIDGDLAVILSKTKAGKTIDFDEKDVLKKHLLNCYEEYKNNALGVSSKNIEQYHRKELTADLAKVIKEIGYK